LCEILQEMIALESASLLALLFTAHPPLMIWLASAMMYAAHIYALYMNKPIVAKHVIVSYLVLAAATVHMIHEEPAVILSYVILVSAAVSACCRKTAAAALLLPLPFAFSKAYVYAYTVAATIVTICIVREEAREIQYV